jgi:hypothetical protein
MLEPRVAQQRGRFALTGGRVVLPKWWPLDIRTFVIVVSLTQRNNASNNMA